MLMAATTASATLFKTANRLYYQPSTDKLICGTIQQPGLNATTASTSTFSNGRSVTGSNGLTGGGTLNQNQVISGVNATTGQHQRRGPAERQHRQHQQTTAATIAAFKADMTVLLSLRPSNF